jgi:hypothetical protein
MKNLIEKLKALNITPEIFKQLINIFKSPSSTFNTILTCPLTELFGLIEIINENQYDFIDLECMLFIENNNFEIYISKDEFLEIPENELISRLDLTLMCAGRKEINLEDLKKLKIKSAEIISVNKNYYFDIKKEDVVTFDCEIKILFNLYDESVEVIFNIPYEYFYFEDEMYSDMIYEWV